MSSTSLALSSPSASLRPRVRHVGGRHPAALAALVAVLLAWPALIALHRSPRLAVPKATALGRVLATPAAESVLRRTGWNRWDVTPVDSRYELLGFYRGPTLRATAGVGFDGRVRVLDVNDLTHPGHGFGSRLATNPMVLVGLGLVFMVLGGVWPLLRLRNLDVLVLASTTLGVVLFDRLQLDRMALLSYAALLYLAVRCAYQGLRGSGAAPAQVPLCRRLMRDLPEHRQLRVLRLVAVALACIVAMVGLSSLHVVDVGYAVMEGATAIVHGLLPYGHIGDVLHGDTYPIGSYLLYVPFAWFSPVRNQWDSADWTLVVAVAAALLAAWGLGRASGSARPRSTGGSWEAWRLAGLWLSFPPLLATVSTGTTDVALTAMLVGALVLWPWPGRSTAALATAGWFKLAPFALLPLWLARLRGRALARAIVALLLISAAMLGVVLALGGAAGPGQMLAGVAFQFTRSAPHTPWSAVGSVPWQQLAQALVLGLLAAAVVRSARTPTGAGGARQRAGLSAAILLGVQIAGSYWTYTYLAWTLPLLALSLFSDSAEAA